MTLKHISNGKDGKFRVFHWDTFDNETFQIGEDSYNTLEEANAFVIEEYDNKIHNDGADQVDIVCNNVIVKKYKVK